MTGPTAVIIPTYEAMPYALKAVRTALETTPHSLVIVVDDGSSTWREEAWASFRGPRLITYRFPKNKGLTRSWNQGLKLARSAGAAAAVAANSDVVFPPGWWEPIAAALAATPDLLAGPVTNAPGHRIKQAVGRYLPDFVLSDDPAHLAATQARLAREQAGVLKETLLNGFCLAATTAAWEKFRFDPQHFFNPKFRMTKNEDELQGRWRAAGGKTGIVPASFVWHYRGVSRGVAATRGKAGKGWFRPQKGKP